MSTAATKLPWQTSHEQHFIELLLELSDEDRHVIRMARTVDANQQVFQIFTRKVYWQLEENERRCIDRDAAWIFTKVFFGAISQESDTPRLEQVVGTCARRNKAAREGLEQETERLIKMPRHLVMGPLSMLIHSVQSKQRLFSWSSLLSDLQQWGSQPDMERWILAAL